MTTLHACPRCGAPIYAGQRFCANCALPLDAESLSAFATSHQTTGQALQRQPPLQSQIHPQVQPQPHSARIGRRGNRTVRRLAGILGVLLTVFACAIVIYGSGRRDNRVDRATSQQSSTVSASTSNVSSEATSGTDRSSNTAAPETHTAIPAATLTLAAPAEMPTPAQHKPGIGDTLTINDWSVSLAKIETRDTITWSNLGNSFKASGKFWVLWVDAKNEANESRSVEGTLQFSLVDDRGATYNDLSSGNEAQMKAFAILEERDPLNANTTPRAATRPILVFDVAADAHPIELIIKNPGFFSDDEVRFNIITTEEE